MKLAYIDSCIYISRFEGIPEYKAIIEKKLQQLALAGYISCISELVSLEVFVSPLKKGQTELVLQYRSLFQRTKTLPVYSEVFKDALQIAQSDNLRAIDALHVAMATYHGCQVFVSSDPHFRNLTTVTPHWIDLSQHVPPLDTKPPESEQAQAAEEPAE